MIVSSLAASTYKQYDSALKDWWRFCNINGHDPYAAKELDIIDFLSKMFVKGSSYGSLNTMRSAIALISDVKLSESSTINRLFKGIFRTRPSAPKYTKTWDVDVVLSKLEKQYPLSSLDLKCLTQKLVMLLAIGTSFRVQSLTLIKLQNISINGSGVEIKINDLIKTSRPGACQPFAFLPFFENRPGICIAKTVKFYIEHTKNIRGNTNNLILTYKKPHISASSQTISRWLKNVMSQCGIDGNFTGHSTRHAATSKAFKQGLNVNSIKNAAGWSKKSQVFAKFYNRQIELEENFTESVFA